MEIVSSNSITIATTKNFIKFTRWVATISASCSHRTLNSFSVRCFQLLSCIAHRYRSQLIRVYIIFFSRHVLRSLWIQTATRKTTSTHSTQTHSWARTPKKKKQNTEDEEEWRKNCLSGFYYLVYCCQITYDQLCSFLSVLFLWPATDGERVARTMSIYEWSRVVERPKSAKWSEQDIVACKWQKGQLSSIRFAFRCASIHAPTRFPHFFFCGYTIFCVQSKI